MQGESPEGNAAQSLAPCLRPAEDATLEAQRLAAGRMGAVVPMLPGTWPFLPQLTEAELEKGIPNFQEAMDIAKTVDTGSSFIVRLADTMFTHNFDCLLYTSDAADE